MKICKTSLLGASKWLLMVAMLLLAYLPPTKITLVLLPIFILCSLVIVPAECFHYVIYRGHPKYLLWWANLMLGTWVALGVLAFAVTLGIRIAYRLIASL